MSAPEKAQADYPYPPAVLSSHPLTVAHQIERRLRALWVRQTDKQVPPTPLELGDLLAEAARLRRLLERAP